MIALEIQNPTTLFFLARTDLCSFHCMFIQIILDVPTVGGRLMLVDMAGSENIEQAGRTSFEAKMQVKSPPFPLPFGFSFLRSLLSQS